MIDTMLWIMATCSPIGVHERSGGTCHLHNHVEIAMKMEAEYSSEALLTINHTTVCRISKYPHRPENLGFRIKINFKQQDFMESPNTQFDRNLFSFFFR
jgi:hypothetical protein